MPRWKRPHHAVLEPAVVVERNLRWAVWCWSFGPRGGIRLDVIRRFKTKAKAWSGAARWERGRRAILGDGRATIG